MAVDVPAEGTQAARLGLAAPRSKGRPYEVKSVPALPSVSGGARNLARCLVSTELTVATNTGR
ncbi:unannotated protein [freshwater metagenome]|uniref:Unannotated protein n=1 Tax=freshwater metagenome TaxID=449393 RepID=A0A6J7F389_9ZZZZ